MDIIKLLPNHISNQIAAGEVIQRPASAVKEMLENSLDSGATIIKIHIKNAGKELIQVVDNGCGMSKKDARKSFERHATSKIQNFHDLFDIKTMGFRGEAMSSIASIAHIEMSTKLTNKELGTKIIIEGGLIKKQENCICSNGTSIKIKNLFFNTPARRNFLKSKKVETNHIIKEFNRIAIANPGVSWNMSIDDKEYLYLEPTNLRQRIINIIGNKCNEKLVPIQETTDLVEINGFIGKPEFAKRTRGDQYFFVNGRFIKSYYLNHAIKKAYTNLIAEKYHPSYFINLRINPKQIDINIHPTKSEIKFENEKAIYSILISSVKKSLGQYNIAPTIDFNTEPSFDLPSKKDARIISEPKIKINPDYNPFESQENHKKMDISEQYQFSSNEETQTKIEIPNLVKQDSDAFQIDNSYILTKYKEKLIIIHQQRAHQRILYEYFNHNTSKNINSQKLLFSQTIQLSKTEFQAISNILTELRNVGFEFEIHEDSLEITSVPTHCIEKNLQNLFDQIIQENEVEKEDIKEKFHLKINKTLSKSLSIKLGQQLSLLEMKKIVRDLMKCEIPSTSPYGLTTYFNISNNEITQKFNK